MTKRPPLVNEEGAQDVLRAINDPVVRNLVQFGLAEARLRVARMPKQGSENWAAGLPDAAFDMRFYAAVLASLFSKTAVLKEVLAGKSLAEASEWDF